MTLSDLQGHLVIERFFKLGFSYSCATATAEHFMWSASQPPIPLDFLSLKIWS